MSYEVRLLETYQTCAPYLHRFQPVMPDNKEYDPLIHQKPGAAPLAALDDDHVTAS
jgi:hypothetical protein